MRTARSTVLLFVSLVLIGLAPLTFGQGTDPTLPQSDAAEGVLPPSGEGSSEAEQQPTTVRDEDVTGNVPESDATRGLEIGGFEITLGEGIVIATVTLGAVAWVAFQAFTGGTKFVNSDNVLENEARRAIFEHIQSHPGVHLRATASALSLSTTNVLWHLRKLEEANLINSKKLEGYKVFYPVAGGLESKRRAIALAVLRNDNASDILEYVLANPSAHQREIARALGVNHGTIRWHLRKLNDAGLVLQVKKEHTSQYYVSELGVQLLGEKRGDRPAPSPQDMERMAAREATPAGAGAAVSEGGAGHGGLGRPGGGMGGHDEPEA